jgi:hypothetical protein
MELKEEKVSDDALHQWQMEHRAKHLQWIWTEEAKGVPIHTQTFPLGPRHPNSYILHKDGDNYVFMWDEHGRYSSYAFWLEHISEKEPRECLGDPYVSAKELGVEPKLIDEYYKLSVQLINGKAIYPTVIDRIREIQDILKSAKIDGSGSSKYK